MSRAAEHSLYMEESAAGASSAAEHVPAHAAAFSLSGPSGTAGLVRWIPADPRFTFDLCWLSGRRIARYENAPDTDVESFVRRMDEGKIDGIPPAKTTEDGDWLECYRVCLGDETLECGRRFSDYTIPRGATLTVTRESIERTWVAVPS